MKSSLSHVALLVSSVEASAKYLNFLGIETGEPETFESEGTKEIYVGSYASESGLLLLLEPISEGPYARAMKKRGPGLHHIAIDVLNLTDAVREAQAIGWKLHSASAETMKYGTAWLYLEGVPTLIEVHQKKELSMKPQKVSKIEFPLSAGHEAFFAGIGLKSVACFGDELRVVVNGREVLFSQITSNVEE